ncbi:unnamed protein product [Urochloa decumbens]|uniref:At1g61320/AtMIF1 LRR domain-containing protein n=1 Tax=Urochloa decumbens TaxID=240449 RepID=A0ABC9BNY2_9POAL
MYTIMSKLPPKEFARTNVLSSKLRCTRSVCPRLSFNGVEVCKCNKTSLHQHTGGFIHEVNAILQKHHGMVIETLEVRIDFVHSILIRHLNNWVSFALSARTKNLTLDLKPAKWLSWNYIDKYVFPFELLDNERISHLQQMQLSFVTLKPSSQYRGFPNLKKLHLQLVHASAKDIGHVLSHCCNLEWLCIDRCNLNDELVVNGPLTHLFYLRIDRCSLTKVEFHAVNLATFVYDGSFLPVGLRHSLKLQSANIKLDEGVFHHVIISLLKGLPNVQNLTLRIGFLHLEKQWLRDNPLKFSRLKNLQLFMFIYGRDVENILCSVSILRSMPFIEDLEVHFTGNHWHWLADVGPRRKDFGGQYCKYDHLKNLWITGFKGARGQLEFLLHVVENAPALEVLTVDTHQRAGTEHWPKGSEPRFKEAKEMTVTSLSTIIPQTVDLHVI